MKIIFFLIIALMLPFRLMTIIGYDSGDTLTNLALSSLKIRSEPGGNNIIGKVPYAAKVVVCTKPWGFEGSKLGFSTEGINGSWVKIQFNEIVGFVFDGFLSHLPAPSLKYKSLKEYAEGCFRHSGKKNIWKHTVENTYLADTMEFFTNTGNYLVFQEKFGYEAYSEELTIQSTSAEECYLIARIIYRSDIDTIISELKNNPQKFNFVMQKDIDYEIEKFSTFFFENGKYQLELENDGCYDIISVIQMSSNIFLIRRSSGC